jgi:hypothetical protein
MMTCSRNLFKHLKHCYQIKTNREMLPTWFSIFCKFNDFFLLKKVIKHSLFIFIFHTCAKFQTKKICEGFQSHCHILKEFHEFLCMMGVITTSGKNSFKFNFVGYELVTKSLGGWVHIWGGGRENKMSKYWCEFFPTKLKWIISPSF